MAKRDHHGVNDQAKASLQRRRDAQSLFDDRRWRGATYVAGYSVECRMRTNLQLSRAFGLVNRWVPAWRYDCSASDAAEARRFLSAVDQVLQWIRNNI